MLDQLRERARELGFAACRVAAAHPPEQSAHFEAWLDAGHAGDMSPWLERSRAKRSDPELVLPGVRSVVVLAMSYWQGGPNSAAGQGRIARYAWGDDYHELIAERLERLAKVLAEAGGAQRCYVDTGPILERSFAAEAGVGWQGKSTMLLSRELGTWFFLAEILTTLELPADPPAAAHCGKCTRCLDACPTAAISPERPFRLEARRCLSYLTIEHKGSIPVEFRAALGDRIYGCDDCLDACPWNRFAQRSREAAFQLRPAMAGRPLREYLELDDDTFRLLFHGSPIKRIKRRGFLRNVCVALGNVGGPDDLPALRRAAADPEPLVAEHAAWAVGQIEHRACVTSTCGAPQI
ncbi:MAG: tRNA epoxyqueuosine(34) reductase QueG [Verrucomicrobia bacterium]|nr:tRNA epoxyqueuosine(34) reductase QueG [Verrucomicrobiota bacterium]